MEYYPLGKANIGINIHFQSNNKGWVESVLVIRSEKSGKQYFGLFQKKFVSKVVMTATICESFT